MNLQTASDFEINKMVAMSLGHKIRAYGGHVFLDDIDVGSTGVDYCNQIDDAWPIILENHIGLLPPDEGHYPTNSELWICSHKGTFISSNKNPLRAAMEVYLTMEVGES